MRTVTVITLLKKRSPGHLRSAPISTPVSAVLGTNGLMSDALQNVRDAPPSDAQNVTESRKSCEVPSCPSFPQDVLVGCHEFRKERPASSDIESLVVRAPAGRSLPAPGSFCKRGVYRRRPRLTPRPFSYSPRARANNRHQNTRLIGPSTFSHVPSSCAESDSGGIKYRQ
jgi:hypothetical protein